MNRKIISLILIFVLFHSYGKALFADVIISALDATKKIFPALVRYEAKEQVIEGEPVKIFTVFNDGEVMGWTVALEGMGKINPITFLVGVDKQLRVLSVYVLEFKDIFGSEIKRRSFLRQFQGKTLKDPLKIGQDIDAVTQATISSQAAASTVRRALAIIEKLQKGFF